MKIKLNLKVITKANRNEVVGFRNNCLVVKINALPEKGKANKALIKFLSSELGIKPNKIEIYKGKTSSKKTILLDSDAIEKLKLDFD